MGLLLSHKRKLRIWPDMYSVSGLAEGDRKGGGKRGDIEIFSAESRFRLFQQLHKIKFEKVTFITLTYPAQFPIDAKIYKGHLKEWRRRFEATFGKIPAIWRLEFQNRGAPHFHILYFDCPFVPIFDLCWMWKSVVHSWDMAHEVLGVDLELITDASEEKLIAFYVGKYIAKVDRRLQYGADNKCGRWWGRWNIKEEDPIEVEVIDWQAELICTNVIARRGSGTSWEPLDPTKCSIFGGSLGTSKFRNYILRLADDLSCTNRGGRG